MEQVLPDGERVSSDSSEESDSDEGTPSHRSSDSISQAEEEDRKELTGQPTEELAEKLAEGPTEESTVGCPASGQKSPLRGVQESDEGVVVHASEVKIHHLC